MTAPIIQTNHNNKYSKNMFFFSGDWEKTYQYLSCPWIGHSISQFLAIVAITWLSSAHLASSFSASDKRWMPRIELAGTDERRITLVQSLHMLPWKWTTGSLKNHPKLKLGKSSPAIHLPNFWLPAPFGFFRDKNSQRHLLGDSRLHPSAAKYQGSNP